MLDLKDEIKVDKKLVTALNGDLKDGMKVAGLIYVSDNMPGFSRKRRAGKFIYFEGNTRLLDKDHINRINKLVLVQQRISEPGQAQFMP